MGIGKFCGHDRRGKMLFERDKKGEIVYKENKPMIKNDFFKITEEFRKYANSKDIFSKK